MAAKTRARTKKGQNDQAEETATATPPAQESQSVPAKPVEVYELVCPMCVGREIETAAKENREPVVKPVTTPTTHVWSTNTGDIKGLIESKDADFDASILLEEFASRDGGTFQRGRLVCSQDGKTLRALGVRTYMLARKMQASREHRTTAARASIASILGKDNADKIRAAVASAQQTARDNARSR